jgi:hypothetical protein
MVSFASVLTPRPGLRTRMRLVHLPNLALVVIQHATRDEAVGPRAANGLSAAPLTKEQMLTPRVAPPCCRGSATVILGDGRELQQHTLRACAGTAQDHGEPRDVTLVFDAVALTVPSWRVQAHAQRRLKERAIWRSTIGLETTRLGFGGCDAPIHFAAAYALFRRRNEEHQLASLRPGLPATRPSQGMESRRRGSLALHQHWEARSNS